MNVTGCQLQVRYVQCQLVPISNQHLIEVLVLLRNLFYLSIKNKYFFEKKNAQTTNRNDEQCRQTIESKLIIKCAHQVAPHRLVQTTIRVKSDFFKSFLKKN